MEENSLTVSEEKHLDKVCDEIRKQGLEKCNLIFGIDYTISNYSQGQATFDHTNLHAIIEGHLNPYQRVICILGETLEALRDDGIIPVYGFGDIDSKDQTVFDLSPARECECFSDVLDAYNEVTPGVKLWTPTNFAPIINKAVEIVKETNKYHILIIATDGVVPTEFRTKSALVDASRYPLSIIVVGVGDGPWDTMQTFDDSLQERLFDNCHFVDFHKVMNDAENPEAAFALEALKEIPEQYKYIKENGMLS